MNLKKSLVLLMEQGIRWYKEMISKASKKKKKINLMEK